MSKKPIEGVDIPDAFYIAPEKVYVTPSRIRKDTGDLTDLKASISQHKQIHPIVVDKDMKLISGFRRLTACKQLNIPVMVVKREDLTDAQMFELELMENLARMDLHWTDYVKSIYRLHELKCDEHGRPGTKRKGWRYSDTAKIIGRSEESIRLDYELAKAVEETPELKKYPRKSDALRELRNMYEVAVEQEIIRRKVEQLANNQKVEELDDHTADALPPEAHEEIKAVFEKLMASNEAEIELVKHNAPYKNGDSLEYFLQRITNTDFFAYAKTLQDESVNLVIADPPYGIDIGETVANDRLGVFNDSPTWTTAYGRQLLEECYRLLVPNAHMYMFFGIEFYDWYVKAARAVGFDLDIVPLVWIKGNYTGKSGEPSKYPGRAYEHILYLRKGNLPLVKRGRSNVLIHDPIRGGDKIHPTEKPVSLLKDLITRSAYPDFVVLDPMVGSGSAIQAAYECGLTALGCELSAESHAKAVHRLANWAKGFYHENV